MKKNPPITVLKVALFILLSVPFAIIIWRTFNGGLGAEPVETLIRFHGEWAIRLLLLTLAITPLRRLTGANWLIRFRRMIGLFAFAYGFVHFLVFLVFDLSGSPALLWEEIVERPFILAGASCLLLLIPLAATSTDGMIRRLGGRAWRRLHRLVYPAAALAVLHFFWLVKSDVTEPAIYALILAILLLARAPLPKWTGGKNVAQSRIRSTS